MVNLLDSSIIISMVSMHLLYNNVPKTEQNYLVSMPQVVSMLVSICRIWFLRQKMCYYMHGNSCHRQFIATSWPLLLTFQEKYIQNTILGKIHTQLSGTSPERHEAPLCDNFKPGDHYHNDLQKIILTLP